MNYIALDEADAIIISPEKRVCLYSSGEGNATSADTGGAATVCTCSVIVQAGASNLSLGTSCGRRHVARPVDIIKNNTTAPQEKGRSMKEDLSAQCFLYSGPALFMPHLSPEQAPRRQGTRFYCPSQEMPRVNAEDVIEMSCEQDYLGDGVNPAVPELLDQEDAVLWKAFLKFRRAASVPSERRTTGEGLPYFHCMIRRFGYEAIISRSDPAGKRGWGEIPCHALYYHINGDPPEVVVESSLTSLHHLLDGEAYAGRPDQPDAWLSVCWIWQRPLAGVARLDRLS